MRLARLPSTVAAATFLLGAPKSSVSAVSLGLDTGAPIAVFPNAFMEAETAFSDLAETSTPVFPSFVEFLLVAGSRLTCPTPLRRSLAPAISG